MISPAGTLLPLTRYSQITKREMKKNVFIPQSVLTDTKYYKSGVVITTPSHSTPNVLAEDTRDVKQQGTLMVDQDGTTIFTPFNTRKTPRWRPIYSSTYGLLREYPSRVTFHLSVMKEALLKNPTHYVHTLRAEFELMMQLMIHEMLEE